MLLELALAQDLASVDWVATLGDSCSRVRGSRGQPNTGSARQRDNRPYHTCKASSEVFIVAWEWRVDKMLLLLRCYARWTRNTCRIRIYRFQSAMCDARGRCHNTVIHKTPGGSLGAADFQNKHDDGQSCPRCTPLFLTPVSLFSSTSAPSSTSRQSLGFSRPLQARCAAHPPANTGTNQPPPITTNNNIDLANFGSCFSSPLSHGLASSSQGGPVAISPSSAAR